MEAADGQGSPPIFTDLRSDGAAFGTRAKPADRAPAGPT